MLPTGDVVIRDGNLTSGAANYKEFWYSLVGLSGEGQNSDGNGQYVRFQTGGGTQTVSLTGGASTLFGNAACPPLGTRPAYTGKLPPYQPGKACYRQTLPDLNGAAYGPSDPAVQTSPATTLPATPVTAAASGALAHAGAAPRGAGRQGGGRVKLAIKKYWKNFAAVVALAVLGLFAAGYIMGHQRFYLPAWVPVLGTDFVDYKANFSTAQSVTPGQGQTVQIAGVDVGEISAVDLVNGQAQITMKLRKKYTPIHENATALLRPKTGLNDMIVQLDPGTAKAAKAPEGWAIPIDRTLPNVNADEVLSALDGDTRDYLQLLVGGAGQALGANGKQLSATFKRFEPLGRDLARLNGALAKRQRAIGRSVHNFRLLADALGDKDDQLATLVDSSNRVFRSFARQNANLKATLQELPTTLQATDTALAKTDKFAQVLGPTLGDLRPGARALGPSLQQTRPFLRKTTPIIKNQLRPFAVDVQPVVKLLQPVNKSLAKITPDLDKTFKVVNELLNELAYNPPGKEEGFLFALSWLNHNGTSLFALQDAHGPIRRGLVFADCNSLGTLQVLRTGNPQLGTAADLLNAPKTSQVCKSATTGTPAALKGAKP